MTPPYIGNPLTPLTRPVRKCLGQDRSEARFIVRNHLPQLRAEFCVVCGKVDRRFEQPFCHHRYLRFRKTALAAAKTALPGAIEYGRKSIRAYAIAPSAGKPGLIAWLETFPGGVEEFASKQPMGNWGHPTTSRPSRSSSLRNTRAS